ncbi:hypothetical protein EST45_27055 [Escherichia coli]|nr:hypothetical protein [Escherichia coli]
MISIIVATLVIIFSYWYFTAKQKEYTGAMKEYMDLAQEKFYLLQQWEVEIQQISKFNSLEHHVDAYSRERARTNINATIAKLAARNILIDTVPHSIAKIQTVSDSILSRSAMKSSNSLNTISINLADE